MKRLSWLLAWVLALVFAAQAFGQAATSGPVFPNPGKTSMSKENQKALGMQVAAEVYQKMPVLPDDSPETQYIRALGRKLAATIPAQHSWPFEFHVIPQKDINAFALPGGQMFINVGTILAAKNEAELAGVMGHEMAHVYLQHSAKQQDKAQKTSTVAGLASVLLDQTIGKKAGGLVGQLGNLGIQMGAQGLMMKYSRGDESQADSVGTMVLHKAGYNPQGMVDFFRTMGAASGGKAPPQFFSSHPNPENRQQAIAKQIASWPAVDYVGDSTQFEQMRKHAAQLKTYSAQEIAQQAKSGHWASFNERNGASLVSNDSASSFPTRAAQEASASPAAVALESVRASARMLQADLGPMKIQRPDNWPITLPEKKGQFVTIAPTAGVTQRGVGYGVLLNGTGVPPGGRMSIDQMTSALIQGIKKNNELTQLGESQAITVGGIEGRATLLESPSPFPAEGGKSQMEREWLVTVPRKDGSMIFMIFVAPRAHFEQFRPTFEAMVRSVQLKNE